MDCNENTIIIKPLEYQETDPISISAISQKYMGEHDIMIAQKAVDKYNMGWATLTHQYTRRRRRRVLERYRDYHMAVLSTLNALKNNHFLDDYDLNDAKYILLRNHYRQQFAIMQFLEADDGRVFWRFGMAMHGRDEEEEKGNEYGYMVAKSKMEDKEFVALEAGPDVTRLGKLLPKKFADYLNNMV